MPATDQITSPIGITFSSLGGVTRAAGLETILYPFEVIKIRLQSGSGANRASHIIFDILSQNGCSGFYKGFAPQLARTCVKGAWTWPMMTSMPKLFQSHHFSVIQSMAFTGLSISAVDALITTPLERAKILSASSGENQFDFRTPWKGSAAQFLKLSVSWSTFLVSQRILRDANRDEDIDDLSYGKLFKIGVQSALIGTIVTTPFDVANVQKQVHNLSPAQFFKQANVGMWYRGFPMRMTTLIIHNIASVVIFEKLDDHSL